MLLRVHISTVYEMMSRNELSAKRIGRTIRIDRDELFGGLLRSSTNKVG